MFEQFKALVFVTLHLFPLLHHLATSGFYAWYLYMYVTYLVSGFV